MPELEVIRVAPGDFDNKYVRIEHNGARNRVINPKKLKSIAEHWDDASKDTVTLIRDPRLNRYLIADGQHRIAAASEHIKGGANLRAMVWEPHEVDDYAAFITAFNRGSPFTMANLMQVYQDRSVWPAAAEKRGLAVTYQRFHGNGYSWTSIIRGVATADHWRQNDRFSAKVVHREQAVNDYWLGYPPESIEEVLNAVQWWEPIARAAFNHELRVGVLYSDIATAVTISVWRKYHHNPALLEKAKQRFLVSPAIPTLKLIDAKQTRYFAQNILAGMNFRTSKERIELFGETGKD